MRGRVRGQTVINVNDIIGKHLGKLQVISYHGYSYSITHGGEKLRHYYLCQCECGRMHLVQRGPLKNDHIHSCGKCGRRIKNHV